MQDRLDLRPFKNIVSRVESAYTRRDRAAAEFEAVKAEFRSASGGNDFLTELRRVKAALHKIWHEGMWFSQTANGPEKNSLQTISDKTDALIKRLELE